MSTAAAGASEEIGLEERPIPGEILAAIAAAATVLLGRNIRIRSIEALQPHEQLSRWTKHGRASVQASHNLRRKRQPARSRVNG